ncbi:PHP domain-containing protein [Tindallia californiensis]|uniref:Polymerase/histidinol phosphatase N-terminal domain-containing protein n=1 Tax=Tindallia californiensis TaxID=159292 RepID=A0A1H3NMY0_9FIRM|nr:PHP domain-containing protein [Tindallia californiensis]SDY90261.1 hypothetical protein SAMN05192546_105199 [Tindallia californiensis]
MHINLALDLNLKIDLHTHSSASDGTLSPRSLIQYAAKHGLSGIALTDHDTLAGLSEAEFEAKKINNFVFVPGIELSTEHRNIEIHILGYHINLKDETFRKKIAIINDARINRLNQMISKLQNIGIEFNKDIIENLEKIKNPGRLHLARALKEMKVVSTIDEAFQKYLSRGSPGYYPRFKLTPDEAINLIRMANGIPVLAHPGLIKSDELVSYLMKYPFEGIEVYYPSHSKADIQKYTSIAQKHGLFITGGSDFHAPPESGIRNNSIGHCSVSISSVSKMITKK